MDKEMMKLNLKANWSSMRKKLRSEYSSLSQADLDYTIGQEDKLFERIEKKTGASRDEIISIIRA